MVTQSDVRALKQQPPTSAEETEAAVSALLLQAASQPAASGATPTVAQGSTTATRRSKRKRRVVVTESGDHHDAELQETYADACKAPAAVGKEAAEMPPRDTSTDHDSSPASPVPLATAADEPQSMELSDNAEPQGTRTQLPASTAASVHDGIDADTNMDAVQPGEVAASSSAAPFAGEHISAKERQQIDAALRSSVADLRKRPLVVPTPEQRRAYAVHVEQQLQDRRLALRTVPGNGDCILASVLLGCEAIGVDVCAEQAKLTSPAHASRLRAFLAGWIREHKQVLFDISGGDDSWRGDAVAIRKRRRGGIRCQPAATRLTLDGCLDLFADTTERKWDIPWGPTDPGAPETNLGDYLPHLLACALNIRIVLINAAGPPMVVGARDAAQRLTAQSSREVVLVQSLRQNHWDVALPIAAAPPPAESDADGAFSPCAANRNVRRRIFAAPPSAAMAQPEIDVAAVQQQHAEGVKQLQQKHEAELLQLRQQHAAEQERAEDENAHAIARAVEETARAMHDIERLTCALLTANQDHQARVRDPAVGDIVAGSLEQLLALQASVSCPPPFLAVTHHVLEQWRHDLEAIDAALGQPFHPLMPAPVDDHGARQACELLGQWQAQLDNAHTSPSSFLETLLLAKKLQCMDQLRPHAPTGSHFSLFEVHALTSRLLAHPRVWPHMVRVPISYFDTAPEYMARRSARFYVKAARAAAEDEQQRVRLVLQQCQVLDSVGLLREARKVRHRPQYPTAPFDTLAALHTQYPAAGPVLDLEAMQQLDADLDAWRAELQAARRNVAQHENDVEAAEAQQLAQAKVDELAAAAPREFEQCMNQSQLFFHPDKRRRDIATSAEEKSAQFSQVKEAWATLATCRALFQELRDFQQRSKAAAAAAREEEDDEAEHDQPFVV